jgi:hypothetical protein
MGRWSWVAMSGGFCSGRACARFARELRCSASSLRGMRAFSLYSRGRRREAGFSLKAWVGLGWRFHFLLTCLLAWCCYRSRAIFDDDMYFTKTNHDRLPHCSAPFPLLCHRTSPGPPFRTILTDERSLTHIMTCSFLPASTPLALTRLQMQPSFHLHAAGRRHTQSHASHLIFACLSCMQLCMYVSARSDLRSD